MKNLLRYVLPVALLCGVANSATVLEVEGTVIPEDEYRFDENLTDVEIPEGVTEIQKGAFSNSHLRYIKLPKTLKYIGDWAFSINSSPIGRVYSLGNTTYNFPYGLSEIEIPENVTQIGYEAFKEGINLKLIKVHNLNIVKDLMEAIQKCHPELVIYCEEENTVILPSHMSGDEAKIADVLAEHKIKQDGINQAFYFSRYDLIKDLGIELPYDTISKEYDNVEDKELCKVHAFYSALDIEPHKILHEITEYTIPDNVSYVVEDTFLDVNMPSLETLVEPSTLKHPIVREWRYTYKEADIARDNVYANEENYETANYEDEIITE